MPIIACYNKECPHWDDNGEPDNCSHPMIQIQKCFNGVIQKDNSVKSKNFYYQELMSNECFCGKYKQKRYSFCFHCYYRLSDGMRIDLWLKIGEGYEESYESAVTFLTENK